MSYALTTIACPLAINRLPEAETAIMALGNPAIEEIREALQTSDKGDTPGTHFASFHVIRNTETFAPYLLFEFSADGSEDGALRQIVNAIEPRLRPIFSLASDWRDGGDLNAYLVAHRLSIGGGWFDNPGVAFAGIPGMTVGRIKFEQSLAARIAPLLGVQPGHWTALRRVADIRERIALDPQFSTALTAANSEQAFVPPPLLSVIAKFGSGIFTTYLWPAGLAVVSIALIAATWGGLAAQSLSQGIINFLGSLLIASAGILLAIVFTLYALYQAFRKAEDRDAVDDRAAERDINSAMFRRENILSQNHMISITRRKPGAIRSFTSRFAFWFLGQAAGFLFAPGFLGAIGTIHFARWVTPPGTRDVIFLSNYDGSWESYLEDFITLAHEGLTGVWSNTVGFPRAENLIEKGATDGERFKRFARRSMIPTLFWYSAYPDLTTTAIRINKQIRRGLSGVMTEDEANAWLALFGSAARPDSKLVSTEIQSLIFGGLGFLRCGTCLIFDLPDDITRAQKWLDGINTHIAFNDGHRLAAKAVVTLAVGARGLGRFGLPPEALATFPYAFLQGMTGVDRARILGDIGDSGAEYWRWGRHQPDVALLVYGESESSVTDLEKILADEAERAGMAPAHRIPLNPVSDDKKEPFRFVDGISQPVIRGTYKGLRNADPIHLVEPGEFIIGYPDNRGNLPPGPLLQAIYDPENLLPLASAVHSDFGNAMADVPRDLGFNGSFLVIRELEQDVVGFDRFCEEQARGLRGLDRLPPPYALTSEFIAAKLVGRWRDGSSLVRFPYESRTMEIKRHGSHASHDTSRPASNPQGGKPAIASPGTSPPKPDNDFLFGAEDPEAIRCPFGAHIRRANPRDSLDPGSADQIAISNRHRIIRVGRSYAHSNESKPGLLFMCLNGDIERQFEFLQQTWLRSPSFHGLSCEKDPLLGDAEKGACSFTIPSREGPARLAALPQFVTTRGGGYFFLPGKRLVDWLRHPR